MVLLLVWAATAVAASVDGGKRTTNYNAASVGAALSLRCVVWVCVAAHELNSLSLRMLILICRRGGGSVRLVGATN